MDIVLSDHVRFEIVRRQLSEEMVRGVAQSPEQTLRLNKKREICQSKYYDSIVDREMLLRVVCEERGNMLFVVTAYKTSKIDRYWIKES